MNDNIKPFDKVLVRYDENDIWRANLYSHYDEKLQLHICNCSLWKCCIPYEGNEHLLGTTDSPKPKRWRAEKGDKYWFISSCEVCMSRDFREDYVDKRHDIGNYFRTKTEAEEMAVKIKALLVKAMLKGGE